MEKTGNYTVSEDALDTVLMRVSYYEKTALKYKKEGSMDNYFMYMGMYIAQKGVLEQLGLVIQEDYDFSKEA